MFVNCPLLSEVPANGEGSTARMAKAGETLPNIVESFRSNSVVSPLSLLFSSYETGFG
jgi:hypothetical protein